MTYRYEATSLEGFVQLLAANYLPHGYWFYVTGCVPPGKKAAAIDAKLVSRYGVALSRQQRARRKLAGQANVHYLRYGDRWVLLATHGVHKFFAEEGEAVRDVRKHPLRVGGYSLTVRQGGVLRKRSAEEGVRADPKLRVRVQIARERYQELKAYFVDKATRASAEQISRELYLVPFEPYAPIRRQLLNILRLLNDKRAAAGKTKIPPKVLRYRRRIVKGFVEARDGAAA